MNDLALAIKLLHEGDVSVVAVRDGRCVGKEVGPGVGPFVRLAAGARDALRSAAVADRIIGRAVALACVDLGVAAVYADLISDGAVAVLQRAGVPWQASERVPFIENRQRTGRCPTEDLVGEISDPALALPLLGSFVEQMRLRARAAGTQGV